MMWWVTHSILKNLSVDDVVTNVLGSHFSYCLWIAICRWVQIHLSTCWSKFTCKWRFVHDSHGEMNSWSRGDCFLLLLMQPKKHSHLKIGTLSPLIVSMDVLWFRNGSWKFRYVYERINVMCFINSVFEKSIRAHICVMLEVLASGVLGRIAWQTFTYLWRRWKLHSHRSIVHVCCCNNVLNMFLNWFFGCSQLCRSSYCRPSIVCLSSLPLLWRTTTILWKPRKIQHTRTRLSTIWAWAMSTYASELNLDKHY